MIARRQPGLGTVLPAAAVVVVATLAGAAAAAAQTDPAGRAPDRVLAFPAPVGEERLDVDRGAMGAWHRIRKLGTTASLLHVTAHPDDEHAGMLTLASRGWGARTALLSLNRGEAGANAIGPELFDALGLIRTRELVLSGRYYGLDDLYFTTAVDYGYSKSVDEAFRSWDREAVLEDMVRVIRLNRPLVVVSRFHGSARDGHGHHHAAGLLTPEAVAAAADPARFPRQISEEGLRPWRVLRTFRGGVRVDEPYDVAVNATGMSPWLGDTYQRWASRGLGLQRSQTAGRVRAGGGRYFYERLDGIGGGTGAGARAATGIAGSFFAGLDTTLRGLPALLGEASSPEADSLLADLDRLVGAVAEAFDFRDPGRAVADLARGLGWVRAAIAALPDAPETRFHLSLKERQFEEALLAASGTSRVRGACGRRRAAARPCWRRVKRPRSTSGSSRRSLRRAVGPRPGSRAAAARSWCRRAGSHLGRTARPRRSRSRFRPPPPHRTSDAGTCRRTTTRSRTRRTCTSRGGGRRWRRGSNSPSGGTPSCARFR